MILGDYYFGGGGVCVPAALDLTAATLQNGSDWPNGGGGSHLHDGDNNEAVLAGARSANSNDVWAQFQLGTAADVTEVKVYGPNDSGMHEASSTSLQFTVYYSTTGSWSGEEVQIGEITGFDGSGSSAIATITCSGSTGKPGYMAVRIRGGSSGDKFGVAEIEATGCV
jgi:hypothetical protein